MNGSYILWVVIGVIWSADLFLAGWVIAHVLGRRRKGQPLPPLFEMLDKPADDYHYRVVFKDELPDGLDAEGKPYQEEEAK